MLNSILLENGASTLSLTFQGMILCSIASLILGLIISIIYMYCSDTYSRNYVIMLALLPILVQAVIMMVNGNLGTGVAIVGAFSLVRFRSIPGSSREIGFIFFTMAVGLATGMGYIVYASIITLIVSLVFVVLSKSHYGLKKECMKVLRITIPENLNYLGLFDDIFEKYTKSVKMDKVKTTNLGSMFELTYSIVVDEISNEKKMIDEIRCRNGNLTVVCGKVSTMTEEL